MATTQTDSDNSIHPETGKSETILEVRNVHRIFRIGDIEVHALRGVNLQVKRGEFVVILGVSGSGKSTLLHILGALDSPTEGQVLIEEKDISQLDENELADIRLKNMGFVFQSFNLMPHLTAQGNVELPLYLANAPTSEIDRRTDELLDLVGLKDRKEHKPVELSGGQRQRVAVARALANVPTIIFADEPTGNLDSKIGAEIINLLREVNQKEGNTFVVVTHDKRLTQVADRVLEMRDGDFEVERIGGRRSRVE